MVSAVDRGYLLLSHHWQDRMGDLVLSARLAGLERLAAEAGLTLVLTVNPFVSTDSANFQVGHLIFAKTKNFGETSSRISQNENSFEIS
jgi:hypothetical protein